jgi:hypothetical protein
MMSLTSFLLPNSTIPVVPISIGVSLLAVSFWVTLKNFTELNGWTRMAVAAASLTFPSLAFTFSFSTLALGIGVGYVFAFLFLYYLNGQGFQSRVIAIFFGACSIGTYDTFAAVLVVLSLFLAGISGTLGKLLVNLGVTLSAFLLSRLITAGAQWVFGVPSSGYVDSRYSLTGVLEDPSGRITEALEAVVDLIFLSSTRFGLSSPTLFISLVVALIGLVLWLSKGSSGIGPTLTRIISVSLIFAVPFGAELLSPWPVTSRSLVYAPVILMSVFVFTFEGLKKFETLPARILTGVMIALLSITTMAQASMVNRIFSAAELPLFSDRYLALQIAEQKSLLFPEITSTPVAGTIIGRHAWPESTITPPRESIGGSFFDLGEQRAFAFLGYTGLTFTAPPQNFLEVNAQLIDDMPSYPSAGWVARVEDVLVIKLSD